MKLALVDEKTGKPMKVGQEIKTFRGESGTLEGWHDPYDPEYSLLKGARVYVKLDDNDYSSEYYPSVIGAAFVRR